MKKVLFVINTLGGAGAERALLELLKRFTPDQYEVDLYILLEQKNRQNLRKNLHENVEYGKKRKSKYVRETGIGIL